MRNAFFERPFSSSICTPRFLRAAMPAPAKAARRDPYKKTSDKEVRLERLWYKEDGMDQVEIAELLRRDKSTMTRLLVMGKKRKPQGRPAILDDAAFDNLVALLDYMVVQADANHEVTVDMLRRRNPAPPKCATTHFGPRSTAACARLKPSGRQVGPSPTSNFWRASVGRRWLCRSPSSTRVSGGGMKRRCKRLYEAGAAISKTAANASVSRPRCHPNRVVGCARPCAQLVKM